MKNDIDVGKLFRAKNNISSSTVDPRMSTARTGAKEKCYVEQGEVVTYLGLNKNDDRLADITLRGKETRISTSLFNEHFERV